MEQQSRWGRGRPRTGWGSGAGATANGAGSTQRGSEGGYDNGRGAGRCGIVRCEGLLWPELTGSGLRRHAAFLFFFVKIKLDCPYNQTAQIKI